MIKSAAKKKPTKTQKLVLNEETNIAELVYEHPEASDVLMAFGLHCVGCFANAFDTIGQGARIHGMHEEEIKELISEIKKVVKSSKAKDKK